ICDQCDSYWHYQCADLSKPPTDQYWYCPDCYNHDRELVIGKGTAIKSDAFKAPDKVREAELPTYHIGKIPGIYCSQSWSNRLLVEEWGIHRAINNVVCGSVSAGAVSLILNYGFKEDKDKGYEFVCSGGGGKLKKDKCNSFAQIKGDQELIKHNLALAKTCDAPVNPIYGAQAIHWRKSQPIRVCRTSNFRRSHPDFAPKKGIRYDGLYKLVKYWPYRGKYRRDDQEYPAWMSAGKAVMRRKGLRTIRESPQLTANLVRYRIPKRIQKLITKDKRNERMWSQIRKMEFWSEYEFLHYLFDTALACSSYACSKPIKNPVTAPCGHICCLGCLNKTKSNVCFTCRAPIPQKAIEVNYDLVNIMQALNWAYDGATTTSTTASDIGSHTKESTKKDSYYPTIKREQICYSLSEYESRPKAKKPRVVIEYMGMQ
ncbi:ubiquitin-like with PHD and RING finger domains 2, partial [Rhizopus stolonifer]